MKSNLSCRPNRTEMALCRFWKTLPDVAASQVALFRCVMSVIGVFHCLLLTTPAIASEENNWAATVSRVADSVVSLQLAQLRDFDESVQGGSNATGFVVDAERGIVLTNRHVVGSGPIRLSATFQNQERVDAVPLYRDPVHDFAFIRYDPASLEYSQPASLALRPDKVRTGMNIRVIGSDGGEQLSILAGTIARLDREVPSYGRYGYNDFNTFYMQAASGTSGGSSGSPVIDIDGDVVALNAAANTKTASSFFLPLERIKHALDKLQTDQPIDRGTFQTLFVHLPFRELKRLGLDVETEQRVRQSGLNSTGMLVVSQVIPGGIADDKLESGDILLSINEQLIINFESLESLLDESIGSRADVSIIRHGLIQSIGIEVADLHALAPRQLLEIGDSVLQDMSIQHARAMNRPQDGVVVTRAGYAFTRANVPEGSVIISVEGRKVSDLQSFIDAMQQSANIANRRMRYIVPGREFNTELAQVQIDNRWFGHRLCSRVDDARFWDCDAIELPNAAHVVDTASLSVPRFQDVLLQTVAPAMVKVDFSIPYSADNVYARNFKGVGILIDKELGLIVVDRNTVPIALGDVDLTFFGSVKLPGSVVFLHPRHNIAFVQYDPTLLDSVELEALQLSRDMSVMPDEITMIGYRMDGTYRRHQIDDISPLTVKFDSPGLPRFQQSTLDVYGVPDVPPSLGGPLVDSDGRVHAFYMSFAYEENREIRQREWAMPAAVVAESLRMYQSGAPYYSLDLQLAYRPVATARQLGLPDDWLQRYNSLPAGVRRTVYVEQVVPGTDAADKLASGDVILAIGDELVSDLFTTERLAQKESIELTVLRAGDVLEVKLTPSSLDVNGTSRLVQWAGASFQTPFPDIGYQKGVDFPGVYVADTQDGSPALWDGLYRNRFVVAVDGEPIESLDEFSAAVRSRKQDEITRLTVMSMSGRKRIVAVQPEYNFWPTFEINHSERGWTRINHAN